MHSHPHAVHRSKWVMPGWHLLVQSLNPKFCVISSAQPLVLYACMPWTRLMAGPPVDACCVGCMQAAAQAAAAPGQASQMEQLAALLRSNALLSPMFARALQQQLALQQEQARGAGVLSHAAAAPQAQQQIPMMTAAQNGHGAVAAAGGQLQQAHAAPQAIGCVQLLTSDVSCWNTPLNVEHSPARVHAPARRHVIASCMHIPVLEALTKPACATAHIACS